MVSRAGHAGLSEGAATEEGCVCRAQCVDIPRAQAWEAMRSMYIFRDPRHRMWGGSGSSPILSDAAASTGSQLRRTDGTSALGGRRALQQETKLILAHARVNYYRRLLKVATVREEAAAAARVQLAAPPGLQQPIEVAKKKRSICPLNKCRACFNEDRNKRPSVAHTRGENGTVCRLNPRRHSHV